MVIKGNRSIVFVDLTKISTIRTYTNYNNDKKFEFVPLDNIKDEYSTCTLIANNKTNLEEAIEGLFMAIQRGAKTIDLDKYVEEKA